MPGELGPKRGLPKDHKPGPSGCSPQKLRHFVLRRYEEGSRPHAWCCGVVLSWVRVGWGEDTLGSQSLLLSPRSYFLPIVPSTVSLCLAFIP